MCYQLEGIITCSHQINQHEMSTQILFAPRCWCPRYGYSCWNPLFNPFFSTVANSYKCSFYSGYTLEAANRYFLPCFLKNLVSSRLLGVWILSLSNYYQPTPNTRHRIPTNNYQTFFQKNQWCTCIVQNTIYIVGAVSLRRRHFLDHRMLFNSILFHVNQSSSFKNTDDIENRFVIWWHCW